MDQKRKFSIRGILSLAALAGLVYLSLNYQDLLDEWRLRNYNPPAKVVALADHTTMNDQTRRLFYINQPDIEGKQAFRQDCEQDEQTIVLGCFVSSQGIFLLRVDDKRLDGVLEVTAAHEVLHAYYERLSNSEKSRVDNMTSDMLGKITDKRILDTVDQYRKSDPNSVPNELHSILGTEVRELSPELEDYYSRYFADRSKIVSYSEDYQAAFTSREDRAKQLLIQINNLQDQINQLDVQLEGMREDLGLQYKSLESRRDTSDPPEFNNQVREYNARVQQFNDLLSTRNNLAEQYNKLREEYNSLVFEEKELIEAIDTRAQSL